MPLLPLIFGASVVGKAISGLTRPKTEDAFKGLSTFEDNPYLMEALQEARVKSKDPRLFEETVAVLNRQFAPLFQKQRESINVYKDTPALYNRALQKINQDAASRYRGALDTAFLENERAKERARRETVQLASMQLQSQQSKEQLIAQARLEDEQRVHDIFGDMFGAAGEVSGFLLGKQFGNPPTLPTPRS